MVSRLRLWSAIQSARAWASATVVIASTSTASYSPKIKVDVIGSKPSASPNGFGRSPTIAFPGAVKTFTLSVFDATGAVTRAVSFIPFGPPIRYSFRCHSGQQGEISRGATMNLLDERIDRCGAPRELRQFKGRRPAHSSKPRKKDFFNDLSNSVRPFDYIVKAGNRPARSLRN